MNKNYAIKETEENTWVMLNENEEVVDTITKDIVVDYCKKECDETDITYTSADGIIDSVWSDLEDDFNLDWIDNYCQDFDKFIAWFDYVCGEYPTNEATLGKYCGATAVIIDEADYSESYAESLVDELEDKGCNVLGVIINE